MISIDKIYYSGYTEQIHIVLYNSEPSVTPFELALPETIKLTKVIDSQSYTYSADYSVVYFNETALGSGEYFSAHIYIKIDPTITPDDISYPEFTMVGITKVTLALTAGDLTSIIMDPEELYSYKMEIVNNETGYQGGIRTAKKISRFSFYEQLLLNSIELGFELEADKFYLELKRMSSYGIPKVNRDNCYL